MQKVLHRAVSQKNAVGQLQWSMCDKFKFSEALKKACCFCTNIHPKQTAEKLQAVLPQPTERKTIMAERTERTLKNLQTALQGESLARNKYGYWADCARAQGHEEVALAFERMAKNEMMHARFWFESLYGKNTPTLENLLKAIEGEFSEWNRMYPQFAAEAREDGEEELAQMFEKVAKIEQSHERQFMRIYAELASKASKASPLPREQSAAQPEPAFRCMFCGAGYEQRQDVCGVCGAIGACEAI